MATPQEQHKQGDIGRRLMWILLAVIAVIVVAVLFFYGITDPSKGPGNVPASGAVAPARENASPPQSRQEEGRLEGRLLASRMPRPMPNVESIGSIDRRIFRTGPARGMMRALVTPITLRSGDVTWRMRFSSRSS